MKYKIVLIVTLLMIGGAYFLYQPDDVNIAESDIEITLEIKAPFSNAVFFVSSDGLVTYRAESQGRVVEDSANFTVAQVDVLHELLSNNNFSALRDRPQRSGIDPEDGSIYTITVKYLPKGSGAELADATIDEVSCYKFNCEDRFLEIKNKILEFWGKDFFEIGV